MPVYDDTRDSPYTERVRYRGRRWPLPPKVTR